MTILTALRTRRLGVAAKHLAGPARDRWRSSAMARSRSSRRSASRRSSASIACASTTSTVGDEKCAANSPLRFDLTICGSTEDASRRRHRHHRDGRQTLRDVLTDNHVGAASTSTRSAAIAPEDDSIATSHALGDLRRIPAADAHRRRDPAARARSSGDRAVAGDPGEIPAAIARSGHAVRLGRLPIEDFSACVTSIRNWRRRLHEELDLLATRTSRAISSACSPPSAANSCGKAITLRRVTTRRRWRLEHLDAAFDLSRVSGEPRPPTPPDRRAGGLASGASRSSATQTTKLWSRSAAARRPSHSIGLAGKCARASSR